MKNSTWSSRNLLTVIQVPNTKRNRHRASQLPHTDRGNAQRLVIEHGRDLRYCHPWNKWLVWTGRRWKVDDTGEVERRATIRLNKIKGVLGRPRPFDYLAAHGGMEFVPLFVLSRQILI